MPFLVGMMRPLAQNQTKVKSRTVQNITANQQQSLKRINWDYDISIEEMFSVICGEKISTGHWNQNDLLIRMIERLSWYDILDFFPPETLKNKLTSEVLYKIHNKEKRTKYERLGKILRGEAVSFTKWGSKYRAECKNTLFSNRWYST